MSDAHPPIPRQPARISALHRASHTSVRIRRLVQTLALALFLWVLLSTRQDVRIAPPTNPFFLADPLAGISSMIAGRSIILPMLIGGAALLAVSVVLGRAWCGWLCPIGTVLDWTPFRKAQKEDYARTRLWRHGKNLLLAMVLIGAALGSLTLVTLDPVTLLFRTLGAGVLPLLNSIFLTLGKALYVLRPVQPAVAWFDTEVRTKVLGESLFYLPNMTLLIFFTGVLTLNIIRPRAWCRYLCPLGALLGIVSRISILRRHVKSDACTSCGRCAGICHTGAVIPERGYASDPAECTNCLDCSGACPAAAISFLPPTPTTLAFQPERRTAIRLMGFATVGALVFRFLPSPEKTQPRLVRPPGATEDTLTGKCIRCGECVKVCPTGAIQPVDSFNAWQYTWTPHLQLRRGYCDYACNACGQVCPTGAIANLSLEVKRKKIIGIAVIDEKRCIPFKDKKECIVCEEMCPLAPKAITLKKGEWPVGRPIVDNDLCNGCGICEHQCPVTGEAAIRIYRSLAVAPTPPPEIAP